MEDGERLSLERMRALVEASGEVGLRVADSYLSSCQRRRCHEYRLVLTSQWLRGGSQTAPKPFAAWRDTRDRFADHGVGGHSPVKPFNLPCTSTRDLVCSLVEVKEESTVCPTHRPSAGNVGSPDPPDTRSRTSAWLGNLRARSTDFERCAAHSARVFISRPAPA
jgi:hypothetical protein